MKALITMTLLGASLASAQDLRSDQHQNGSRGGGHGRPFRFPGLLFSLKIPAVITKWIFSAKWRCPRWRPRLWPRFVLKTSEGKTYRYTYCPDSEDAALKIGDAGIAQIGRGSGRCEDFEPGR